MLVLETHDLAQQVVTELGGDRNANMALQCTLVLDQCRAKPGNMLFQLLGAFKHFKTNFGRVIT
ncbi:hypothetical protein D3C80_1212860 [compost metagenome]